MPIARCEATGQTWESELNPRAAASDNDAGRRHNVGTIKPSHWPCPVKHHLGGFKSTRRGYRPDISQDATASAPLFVTAQINGDNFASFALRITGCIAGAPKSHSVVPKARANEPSLEASAVT